MTGRDMDKAKKETILHLVILLASFGGIMVIITRLPNPPVPRDWYLSPSEMLLADVLALTLVTILIFIGIVIGRFIEARQYQRNGKYLGKEKL